MDYPKAKKTLTTLPGQGYLSFPSWTLHFPLDNSLDSSRKNSHKDAMDHVTLHRFHIEFVLSHLMDLHKGPCASAEGRSQATKHIQGEMSLSMDGQRTECGEGNSCFSTTLVPGFPLWSIREATVRLRQWRERRNSYHQCNWIPPRFEPGSLSEVTFRLMAFPILLAFHF